MRIFGRETAQVAAIIVAVVQLATSVWLPLTVEQQGTVNAVAVALAGFVTALAVSKEKAAPLVAGLLQALVALAISFGITLPQTLQSTIMIALATLASWWLRTQVWAPVPAEETTSLLGGRHSA